MAAADRINVVQALTVFTLLTSLTLTSCRTATDTERLEATITEQAGRLTDLESIIMQQASKLTQTDALVERLTAVVDNVQALAKFQDHNYTVAFDVQFKHDPQHNVTDNDIMIFDNVKSNLGNGYNVNNGTFHAPVSGVYVFHLKVTPSPRGRVYVYLMVGGARVDSADANDVTESETAVSTKIMQLKRGDSVWMMKSNGETSVRGWAHTKLSGFLLHPTA